MVDLLGTGVFKRDGEDSVDCVVFEKTCFGVREVKEAAGSSDRRLSLCESDTLLGVGCVAGGGVADFSGVSHANIESGLVCFVVMTIVLSLSLKMPGLRVIVMADL
jgi:hypothetical protein